MPTESQRTLLWIVAVCFFMQTLDTTIVNTALPAMAHSLGQPTLALKPVVVAYSLTMATLTPASGWLSDRFGTRRLYFAAVLIFAIGSLCCATSQTLGELTASRVLQGIGGSMLLPVGRLAVLRRVPGDQYIAALAFVSIEGQVGPIFGPTLGGLLAQFASWHWIFLINVPLGAVGMWAIQRYLPEDAMSDVARFDFVGCGLLSLAMVTFSLALDTPGPHARLGWAALLMAASAASAAGYMLYATRAANPLFRLSLLREPNIGVGLIGNLVCRIGSSSVPFLLPLLMQLELGYSPVISGLMMLPTAIAGTISKPWIAPLVQRHGYVAFLLVNTVLVGLAIMSFAAIAPGWPLALQFAQLALFGATNSMQYAAMNSVTLKGLNQRDAANGNSLFSMVQMLAISLGVTVGGVLVDLFGHSTRATHAVNAGFAPAFLCMGAITLVSALVFRRLDTDALGAKR
jgi:MFS transporter, DHA2 family, multidrug resistance protein